MFSEENLEVRFPEGSIEELEARVKAMKAAKAANAEAIRKATPIIMRYEIGPADQTGSMFDKIMDDSCVLYRITGTIANKAEAETAGHDLKYGPQGGMNFLFNTLSGKFVVALGGGHYYVSSRGKGVSEEITWERLASFVIDNPEGGDITNIILDHRKGE